MVVTKVIRLSGTAPTENALAYFPYLNSLVWWCDKINVTLLYQKM